MTKRSAFLTPSVVLAVLCRPLLWGTAVRQIVRLSPRRWWSRAPFLPIPPADYMEFRMVTQYGGDHGSIRNDIRPIDVVDYLQWCKQWNRSQ